MPLTSTLLTMYWLCLKARSMPVVSSQNHVGARWFLKAVYEQQMNSSHISVKAQHTKTVHMDHGCVWNFHWNEGKLPAFRDFLTLLFLSSPSGEWGRLELHCDSLCSRSPATSDGWLVESSRPVLIGWDRCLLRTSLRSPRSPPLPHKQTELESCQY